MSEEYCCEHARAAGRIEKVPKFLRYGRSLPDPRNWHPNDAIALFRLFANSGEWIRSVALAEALGIPPFTIRGGVSLKWKETADLLGDGHSKLQSRSEGRGNKMRLYSKQAALLITFWTSTREAFAFQASWVDNLDNVIGEVIKQHN